MNPLILFITILFILNICAVPLEKSDNKTKENNKKEIFIQEVPYGTTVTLSCRSNDAEHNFLFWELASEEKVIGPGNAYDLVKYNYEVLSGNLTIKSVSQNEEGFYTCVSKGVKGSHINRRTVHLIVEKDWEDVWENDSSVNAFRVTIIILFLFILCGGAFVAYRIWKNRFKAPSYLEASDDEEDSGEEIFAAPGTSRDSENIVLDRTSEISTDFGSILDTANK